MKTKSIELTESEAALIRGLLNTESMKIRQEQNYWEKTVNPPMPHVSESLQPRLDDVDALGMQFANLFTSKDEED